MNDRVDEIITEALVREACPELAGLGGVVELWEVSHREVKAAMRSQPDAQDGPEALLGASLHVDGVAFGYEALQDLPGRYSFAIAQAARRALVIHGLRTDRDEPRQDKPPGEP